MPDVIGHDKNEGNVETYVTNPFPISDLSIVPKSLRQPTFLLSICLSATHISFGSIRMEPVFMALGQSTAFAVSIHRL